MSKIIDIYKGIGISMVIVCYDIRFSVLNGGFRHFATIEDAKKYIDEGDVN